MREELDTESMHYGLSEAFSDLRWLKEQRVGAQGLTAMRLDDSITAQREVVRSLFRAYNERRRQCRNSN